MRFHFTRRQGKFGNVNIRNEKHGKDKVPASDAVIVLPVTLAELDMLMPVNEGTPPLSSVFYDAQGNLQTPYLSPLAVNRSPEGVRFMVWDSPTNEEDCIELEECRVKGISLILADKGNIKGKLTVQMHDDPVKHSARLRLLMDQEREFMLDALQETIFEAPVVDEDDEQPELDLEPEDETAEA